MRLPSKDSAPWRAGVTATEGFVVFIGGLITIPGVGDYILHWYPQVIPLFPAILYALSFLRNRFLRKDVKNY